MAPGPWRFLVRWHALPPPAQKGSTPFERLASRSAPGPTRALAPHATNPERPTRPKARQKHAHPQQPPEPTAGLPPLHRHAAGIDGGRAEPYVAVPPDRSPEPVRRFARLTADLHAVADWLPAGHLDPGVMESTGGSWIPRFHMLAARGCAVHLVNARHAHHLPGRTTASTACQWRHKLHTFGRLTSSGRPTDDLWVVRSSWRQRHPLISAAATGLQHRPKALTARNVQLAKVISDISGVTGLAILRAGLAGDRDPATRAACKDDRMRASPHTMAKRLEGHWREEWLFPLRHSLELYECDRRNIAEGATQIAAHLRTLASKLAVSVPPLPTPTRRPKKARRHDPHVARHPHLSRSRGVDFTRLDGIEGRTAHTRIAEIGLDMSRWNSEKPVASWLG